MAQRKGPPSGGSGDPKPFAALGERIRAGREAASLTQEALGEMCGVDRTTVIGWEQGRRHPERRLEDIAVALRVSMDALAGIPAPTTLRAVPPPPKRPIAVEGEESPPEYALPLAWVPLFHGPVPAGLPIHVGGEIIGEVATTSRAEWAVRVRGDSMVGEGIQDGDVLFCRSVHALEEVREPAVVIALIDGEVTCKKLVRAGNSYILRASPLRPDYPDISCDDGVSLQGVVIETRRAIGARIRRAPPPERGAVAPLPPEEEFRAVARVLAEAMARQASANEKQAGANQAIAEAMRAQAETNQVIIARLGRQDD